MVNILKIALPVMTHKESEIKAFLAAKERLERQSQQVEEPVEVGVFLYYPNKKFMQDKILEQQLANQRRFKLPIFHAQAPIFQENSFAFAQEETKGFEDRECLLETTIRHAARMRDLGPKTAFSDALPVEAHPGIIIYHDFNNGDLARPASYSPEVFLSKKQRLLDIMRERYLQLKDYALTMNVKFGIENCHSTTMEPDQFSASYQPRLRTTPLNDIASLRYIAGLDPQNSQGETYLVFDVAHQGTAISAPEILLKNGHVKELAEMLAIQQCSSVAEFLTMYGSIDEKLKDAMVIHMSNTSGMGLKLPPELETTWGKDGTYDGVIPKKDITRIMDHARQKNKLVVLELDYDIAKIPELEFREADGFFNWLRE